VHRDVIYTERTKVLEGEDLRANIFGMAEDELRSLVQTHMPGRNEGVWDVESLVEDVKAIFPLSDEATEEILGGASADEAEALVLDEAEAAYDAREAGMGAENMRLLERLLLLQTIDRLWVEHLTAMDEMRQGIGLQAYGHQDPLVAYKREAHDMWEQLLEVIRQNIARAIYHVGLAQQPVQPQPATAAGTPAAARQPVGAAAGASMMPAAETLRENRGDAPTTPAPRANGRKIVRNDPCYCGSGKKYKRCHGLAA
jgi:preprotein translocase subunit SecA